MNQETHVTPAYDPLPPRPAVRDPLRRIMLSAAVAISGTMAASGYAQEGVQLPDLGSGEGRVLSHEEERQFPLEFERTLRAQGLLIDDPIVRTYFEDMGHRLASFSDRRGGEFHFYVLKIPGINAFAAPAGVVGLNAGLILRADNEHEVAGVLAHEVAHVTQNHLLRGMEEAQRVSIPIMLATLGAVVAGGMAGGMSGDAVQGLLAGGMGLAHQMQINYTRQNEAEADRIGIHLMARAGFDPKGMAAFFDTLNRFTRAMGDGPPEYLRTHPLTVGRLAEARERAEQIAVGEIRDEVEFHFAQARLEVLMEAQPDNAARKFRTRLEEETGHEPANRYGLALALIRSARTEAAGEQLAWLLDHDPDRQLFRLLEAELLLSQDRVDESLAVLESLHRAYGSSRVIALSYAEALLHDDDPERARRATELLRRQARLSPGDMYITGLLARAANRAGDEVRAAEAVAENYYLRGGLSQAIEQLERVARRDDLDYYQRARISARLNELRAMRAREGRTERVSG